MTDQAASPTLESADFQRILQLLPHRAPMLLVERLTSIVTEGTLSCTGHKAVGYNEPWFAGHFPGFSVMPGVLIVEAMAQTAGALVMHSMGTTAEGKLVFFMTIDKARFRHPVVPGDQLRIPVKLDRSRGPVWRFIGEAYVGDKLCAEAEFAAMIRDA